MNRKNKVFQLPRLSNWIIKKLFKDEEETRLGDFHEVYNDYVNEKGLFRAWLLFNLYLLKSIPRFLITNYYLGITIFKNYILTTYRIIKKQKLNSSLNVFGLTIAIASCLIIFSHIQSELSYENCFPKADRIYRLDIDAKYGDTIRNWTNVPLPLGPTLKEEFPEIEEFVRISDRIGSVVLRYQSHAGEIKSFEETNGFYAEQSIIPIFDLHFIAGDAATALENSGSIVLTESTAYRYFGSENPIGKSLVDIANGKSLLVTGIIPDLPDNTHLHFDFLISLPSWLNLWKEKGQGFLFDSRTWKALKTYVLIKPGQQIDNLRAKMPAFSKRFHINNPKREEAFLFQPIKDIHLYSHRENELSPNSDIIYVYIFAIIALFILIIAAVNFINISLAQAFKRFKEVGIRKVLGAQKKQIFNQFIGESFILTSFAALLSMVLVGLFLPAYNDISGKNLLLGQLFSPDKLLLIFILVLFLSLAAGFYPSLFISKLPPSIIFSNQKNPKSSVSMIRKGLVIVQFVISVFMILATITVYQQLQYFKEVDLGFNKSGLIAVKIFGEFRNPEKQMGAALKDKLMNYSGISDVSFVSYIPGDVLSIEHLIPEGRKQEELSMVRFLTVDEDYLNTMEIDLLEGRNFSHYIGNDYRFILNGAAVKALDLREPIGAKCRSYRGNGEVIGVMKDFNFESLHDNIEPLILEYKAGAVRSFTAYYMVVKCKGKNVRDAITFTESEFNKIAPDHLFNYIFISDKLERLYYLETNLSDIFKSFSILSILISCLGLFGLSVYTAELRVKEIGIRKVLGATTARITTLLSKDFIVWVIAANVIAWPLANYFMNEWLNNFAYRIEMSYWIFLVGGLLSLGIALFTVSYQSIKAARANPIASLKNE